MEALKFSVGLAFGIMVFGTIIFQLIPGTLLDLFSASEHMKEIGIPALRIISVHFPLAGIAIALGSVFQAFSKPVYSLILSVCRQLLALIPAAWLLSLTGNVRNVWFAFPIAEVVSLCLSIIFFKKIYSDIISKL